MKSKGIIFIGLILLFIIVTSVILYSPKEKESNISKVEFSYNSSILEASKSGFKEWELEDLDKAKISIEGNNVTIIKYFSKPSPCNSVNYTVLKNNSVISIIPEDISREGGMCAAVIASDLVEINMTLPNGEYTINFYEWWEPLGVVLSKTIHVPNEETSEDKSGLISVNQLFENDPSPLVGEDLSLIGILSVPQKGNACAGNCVEIPFLKGLDTKHFLPLFGDIKEKDDGKLIEIYGKVIETPEGTIPNFDYFGENPQISLEVSKYNALTDFNYHEFLISESTKYIEKNFGCAFSHDKEIGWGVEDKVPYLSVKWVYFGDLNRNGKLNKYDDFYIELHYDLEGKLIEMSNHLDGLDVCKL